MVVNDVVFSLVDSIVSYVIILVVLFFVMKLVYEKNGYVVIFRYDEGMFDFVWRDRIFEVFINFKQVIFIEEWIQFVEVIN